MKRFIALALFLIPLAAISSKAQGVPTGTVHSVTLTWTAPSPVGGSGTIAGYNIYRTLPGPPAYIKLNATPIAGLTMIDSAVASGTTYGYCGTTMDSAGKESACTVPVSATVPSNPNAQGNFTATGN